MAWISLCVILLFLGALIPYSKWKLNEIKAKDDAYAKRRGISYDELQNLRNAKRKRKISRRKRKEVFRRANGKCRHCGAEQNLEIDHIFPFSRGGGNEIENLQLLCSRCNNRKSDAVL